MPCEVSPTAAHAAEVSTTVTGQPHAIRSPYQSTDLSLGLAIKSSQMNPSILSRCRKQGAKAPSLSCATCSRGHQQDTKINQEVGSKADTERGSHLSATRDRGSTWFLWRNARAGNLFCRSSMQAMVDQCRRSEVVSIKQSAHYGGHDCSRVARSW